MRRNPRETMQRTAQAALYNLQKSHERVTEARKTDSQWFRECDAHGTTEEHKDKREKWEEFAWIKEDPDLGIEDDDPDTTVVKKGEIKDTRGLSRKEMYAACEASERRSDDAFAYSRMDGRSYQLPAGKRLDRRIGRQWDKDNRVRK